jgi:hypothetical protein
MGTDPTREGIGTAAGLDATSHPTFQSRDPGNAERRAGGVEAPAAWSGYRRSMVVNACDVALYVFGDSFISSISR